MREDYEKTIHSLVTETFKKTWVKKINKDGKFMQWQRATFLILFEHTTNLCYSFFVFIVMSGGYMEWNLNTDKLILEWLANRIPPNFIRVNILSMALATNANYVR